MSKQTKDKIKAITPLELEKLKQSYLKLDMNEQKKIKEVLNDMILGKKLENLKIKVTPHKTQNAIVGNILGVEVCGNFVYLIRCAFPKIETDGIRVDRLLEWVLREHRFGTDPYFKKIFNKLKASTQTHLKKKYSKYVNFTSFTITNTRFE